MRVRARSALLLCASALLVAGCGSPPPKPAPPAETPKVDKKDRKLSKAAETGYTALEWSQTIGRDLETTLIRSSRPDRIIPVQEIPARLEERKGEKVKVFTGPKPPKKLNSAQAWFVHVGQARAILMSKFGDQYVLIRITADEGAYPVREIGTKLPKTSTIVKQAKRLAR